MPPMGMSCSPTVAFTWPYTSLEERTSGSMLAECEKASAVPRPTRLYGCSTTACASIAASVICLERLVSRHTSQLSTVPKASLPCSAFLRAPATLSRIQATLVAENTNPAAAPCASESFSGPRRGATDRTFPQCGDPATRSRCGPARPFRGPTQCSSPVDW